MQFVNQVHNPFNSFRDSVILFLPWLYCAAKPRILAMMHAVITRLHCTCLGYSKSQRTIKLHDWFISNGTVAAPYIYFFLQSMNLKSLTTVFVEQPLALPWSAKYISYIRHKGFPSSGLCPSVTLRLPPPGF